MDPAREIAERIVATEQAKCRTSSGIAWGCITHIRDGDNGHAGGSLVDAIANAIEDAREEGRKDRRHFREGPSMGF